MPRLPGSLMNAPKHATARVPRTLVRTARDEHDRLELRVLDGELPPELTGHLFVMAAAGDAESGGLPRPEPDSTTILCGDGLITRVDFDGTTARLSSRVLEGPDALIEKELQGDGGILRRLEDQITKIPGGFFNHGIARMDWRLGVRNQLNTAIEIVPSPSGDRFLVTWDAGRPWEIDPVTLELQTPIGTLDQWRTSLDEKWAFPLQFTTAHPAVDRATGQVFFASWGLNLSRWAFIVREVLGIKAPEIPLDESALRGELGEVVEKLVDGLAQIDMIPGERFEPGLRLLVWDGEDHPETFELVDPEGEPIALRETMHQVLCTERWVVLVDTAFKVGPMSLFQDIPGPLTALRRLTRTPMKDDPRLFLVRRSDLVPGSGQVTAQEVRPTGLWAGNFVHGFAADGPDGEVHIHVALTPGADVAEWIRSQDVSPFDGGPVSPDLLGCFALGVMDRSKLGRVVCSLESGAWSARFEESDSSPMFPPQWGLALGTTDTSSGPSEPVTWNAVGFWRELYTQEVWDLYEDLPMRDAALEDLREWAEHGGPPASLVTVDPKTNQVVDAWWDGDRELFLSTPQVVGDRWLAVMVWHDEDTNEDSSGTELWLFERGRLSEGPIARLGHPRWWLGFTMHGHWAATIARRTAPYRVSALDELDRRSRFWILRRGRRALLRRLIRRWRRRGRRPGAPPWMRSGDLPRRKPLTRLFDRLFDLWERRRRQRRGRRRSLDEGRDPSRRSTR